MPGSRLVEGGRNNFAFDRALHVGDFFRALIDQEDHQNDFGMIRRNRVGDVLQQHGLAGARRRNDQTALAFAQRGQQVHDAGAGVVADGFQLDALLRIQRRQVVEQDLVAGFVRGLEVDGFNLDEREVFFPFVWRAHLAADGVASLEVELADLGRGDVDIIWAREVVVIG